MSQQNVKSYVHNTTLRLFNLDNTFSINSHKEIKNESQTEYPHLIRI